MNNIFSLKQQQKKIVRLRGKNLTVDSHIKHIQNENIKSQTQANSWTNRQKVTQSSMKTTLEHVTYLHIIRVPYAKIIYISKTQIFNLNIK